MVILPQFEFALDFDLNAYYSAKMQYFLSLIMSLESIILCKEWTTKYVTN